MEAVVRRYLPAWKVAKVSQLQGGITNLLYLVENITGEKVLVRVYGANTEVLIDRETDERMFQALSDKGFGPHLYGVFGEWACGGVLSF